jgi:hypothetical protein
MAQSLFTFAALVIGAALVWIGDWLNHRRARQLRQYELCRDAVRDVLTAWSEIDRIKNATTSGYGPVSDTETLDRYFDELRGAVVAWLGAINAAKLAPLSPEAEAALDEADRASGHVKLGRRDFNQLDGGRVPVMDALERLTLRVREMAP